jgi:mutator protein MutT
VVAAVIRREGRILLTRRPPGSHLAGLWEFPGGKREPGESLAEALARELTEELHVTAAVGEQLYQGRYHYPDRTVELHFFACRLVAGEPAPVGCDALAWVAPEAMAAYPMPPADAEFAASLSA